MEDFNKRWKIVEESNYEEEFKKFKTRILTIFSDVDNHVEEEIVEDFCNRLGIPVKWKYDQYGYKNWGTNIIDTLKLEYEENKFYFILELVLNLPVQSLMGFSREEKYSKDILVRKFFKALDYSKVNLKAVKEDGKIILYPAGESVLDNKLVDNVLSFLDETSQKHFIDALKSYKKKTTKDSIKSAESLRRSLEEFLRYKLKNTKGLQANIIELQTRLKEDKRDSQIRKIIDGVFRNLDTYFNENSKHNDGAIDESENEFLIYQVGVLSRYINANI